jgi:hypothetical protein
MTEAEERAALIRSIREKDDMRSLKKISGGAEKRERADLIASIRAKKAEPTVGAYLRDIGRSTASALGKGGEGILDILSLPSNLGQRVASGVAGAFDEDPETTVWGGLSETPPIGQLTRYFAAPLTGYAKENQEVPEGANRAFDVVRTGVEEGVPLLVGGQVAAPFKLLKGAQKAAQAFTSASNKGAAGAALGGAGGEQIGDVLGNRDAGRQIGAITGSILGDWRGVADLVKGGLSKGRTLTQTIKRNAPGMKSPGVTLDNASDAELKSAFKLYIANALKENKPAIPEQYYDDLVDKMRNNLAAGREGSVAQLADDAGLRQFELHTKRRPRDVQVEQQRIDARINEQAQQPIREVAPTGVAEEAQAIPKTRVRAVKERLDTGLGKRRALAKTRAEQARTDASRTTANLEQQQRDLELQVGKRAAPDEADVTAIGREGYRQADDAVGAQYREGWDLAGDVPQDRATKMVARIERQSKNFTEEQVVKLNRVKNNIEKLRTAGTSRQLQTLDRSIGDAKGQARNDPELTGLLDSLRNELRDGIPAQARSTLLAADKNYPNFLVFKKASKDANKEGGEFTSSQLATGQRGVANQTRLNRGEGPMEDILQGAVAQEKQLKGRENLAKSLRSGAESELGSLPKNTKTAKRSIERSPTGQFAKPDSAVVAARKAIGSKTAARDLQQILKGSTPASKENIRRAFAKEMGEEFTNSKGVVKPLAQQAFKRRRKAYEKSGLFTSDEMDNIEKGLIEGQKMYLGKGGEKLAAIPQAKRRVAEGIASLFGAKVGAFAFGSPLIGAGLGKKYSREGLRALTTAKAEKLAYELSVNPKKFADIAEKMKNQNLNQDEVFSLVERLAIRAGVMTAVDTED